MASALESLREALTDLADIKNADTKPLSLDICKIMEEFDVGELDMAISLLLQAPEKSSRGILAFLQQSIASKEHIHAKATFLEFLADFITQHPSNIIPYAVSIKNVCQSMFSNDESVKVRTAAVPPLINLITQAQEPKALDIVAMFNRFYSTYAGPQAKLTSTVKGSILEILGVISHRFPEAVDDKQRMRLLDWFLKAIQSQLIPGAKQELTFLAGALRGLDSFLLSFAADSQASMPKVLEAIRFIVNVPEDLSRVAAPIAGLRLFANQIAQFRGQLIGIQSDMWDCIVGYCQKDNAQMSKTGYQVLDIFLREIASVLSEAPETTETQRCFWIFMDRFHRMLNYEDGDSITRYKAISMAIRGYGYFAGPCKKILNHSELENLLNILLKMSAYLFSSSDESKDNYTHRSAFLQAYTYIAREYEVIPEPLLAALHQMAGSIIVNFTRMSIHPRVDCVLVLNNLLHMLYEKGEGTLRGFADAIIYKLLVFTCSDVKKPLDQGSSGGVGLDQDMVWHSYTFYLFLWETIFKATASDNSDNLELRQGLVTFTDDRLEHYLTIMYGSTMRGYLRLISLLNLSVSSDVNTNSLVDDENDEAAIKAALSLSSKGDLPISDAYTVSTVPLTGDVAQLRPNCAKDFIIFQNLCEFWQIFLPKTRPDLFAKWVFVISEQVIQLSAKNPQVSGYYKMLSICLQVCQSISYFKPLTAEESATKMEIDGQSKEVERSGALLKKYAREVQARLEQYKDDLLASSLQLVLSCPAQLIPPEDIVAPMRLAFKLGLGYLPLTSVGLDALDRWIDVVPEAQRASWLGSVLPSLNDYLMVDVGVDLAGDDEEPLSGKAISGKASNIKSKRQASKAKKSELVLSATANMTAGAGKKLIEIQYRILMLLGRMGGNNRHLLSQEFAEDHSDILAWDKEGRLKFKIPFEEMKVDILLDEMIPRISELAESSLNRKVKVAACELLHSLVVLLVGTSTFKRHQDPRKSSFQKIYGHIFPIVLRLAVDVDQVTRSLFAPLVLQLIHWFTSSAQYENPETVVLLVSLLDAACDTLGPLRDFGAECLGEFVKWSIKHSSASASGVDNVKSLVKRIIPMAAHSSPSKRLGASLVVNRIYRVLREEATLVDQYTFELLYWMLFSLKLSDGDHVDLGTSQLATSAVIHLQRIIHVKAKVFLVESGSRRSFPGLAKSDLSNLVDWLLSETARAETEYSKVCRILFDDFIKLLPGGPTTGLFIKNRLSANRDYLTRIYKVPGGERALVFGTAEYGGMSAQLSACLTNYIWLLQQHVPPEAVTSADGKSLLNTVTRFIKSIVDQTRVSGITALGGSTVLTPNERLRIAEQQTTMIRKVVAFVATIIAPTPGFKGPLPAAAIRDLVESGVFGSNLFTLIGLCLFRSQDLGFDSVLQTDSDHQRFTHEIQASLLTIKALPDKELLELGSSVADVAFSTASSPKDLDLASLRCKKLEECRYVIHGLYSLHVCGMLPRLFGSNDDLSRYMATVCAKFLELQTTEDPVWISYCSTLLEFVLTDQRCRNELWIQLLASGDASAAASVLYQKYSSVFNRHLAINFSEIAPILCMASSESSMYTIWSEFLDFLVSRPSLREEREKFLDQFTRGSDFLKRIVKFLGVGQASVVLSIWTRLVALSPRILRDASPVFADYFLTIYLDFYSVTVPLNIMASSFPLLPVVLAYDDVSWRDKVERTVRDMVTQKFPLTSRHYEQGSAKYNDYISALELLLRAMVMSRSVGLFKVVAGILVGERDHSRMDLIHESFSLFALKLPMNSFLEVMKHCVEMSKSPALQPMFQRNMVHEIMIPLLKLVPPLSLTEFYKDHIVYFMEEVKRAALVRPKDAERKLDYWRRASAMELIQLMYMRLPAEAVNTKDGAVLKAYKSDASSGKELTTDVIRTCQASKYKETIVGENSEVVAARLGFYQASYNALASAVICTQKKENFFQQFLFKDVESKKELVWDTIVDPTTKFDFKQVLSRPMLKTKLSNLRAKSALPTRISRAQHSYLSSQYLRDSSVSQSMGLLDEGHIFSDQGNLASGAIDTDNSPAQSAQEQSSTAKSIPEVELELDAINVNPCMGMILLAMHELHTTIHPPPETKAVVLSGMPPWMSDVFNKFVNENTSLNVRLFITKMICNMPEVFEIYAPMWIRPLMQLAMKGESYGDAMSYFVHDICALLIVWGPSAPLQESDKGLLRNFVEYLMKHVDHSARHILRNNLELIKGVFEVWGPLIVPPTAIIFEKFSRPMKESAKIAVGLQLLGIVLTHGREPYCDDHGVQDLTIDKYYDALSRNLLSPTKEIYTAASEVAGLVLKYMMKHDCLNEVFENGVQQRLNDIHQGGSRMSAGHAPFLNRLYKVQIHFPAMVEVFSTQLLFMLPSLMGADRAMCLEILASRAASIPRVLELARSSDMLSFLHHKDYATQFAALSVLYALHELLTLQHIHVILDAVISAFANHPRLESRKLFFALLVQLFERLPADNKPIMPKIKTQLLSGLADPSESIRRTVVQFWYDKDRVPRATFDRLQTIMGSMFDPETEDRFLQYSGYMLLDASKHVGDYARPIFDDALPNAKFTEDLVIDTFWRHSNTMTPLFVPTAQTQIQLTQASQLELESDEIRATQTTFSFSLTMDNGVDGIRSKLGHAPASNSSFLFKTKNPYVEGHIDSSGVEPQLVDKPMTDKYRSLHIRNFQNDASFTPRRFAKLHEVSSRAQSQKAIEKEAARSKTVSMIRKYRVGELPDIQIKHSEIIRPLQALAEIDTDICRMLVSKLVTGILSQVDASTTMQEQEAEDYKAKMAMHMNTILSTTNMSSPPLVGSMLRVFYDADGIFVPPDVLSRVSIGTSNQNMGIVLLEKQIENPEPAEERSSRRRKTDREGSKRTALSDTADISKKSWTELAKIYKSVEELDVYKSIYESKIALSELTKAAISAEVVGDFIKARDIYVDAIINHGDSVDSSETTIWENGRSEVMEKLTMWSTLSDNLLQDMTEQPTSGPDLNLLWDEHYPSHLAYFLNTHIKLVDGKEEDGMLVPWSDENPNPLFTVLDQAFEIPGRRTILESQFQVQLAIASLMRNDYRQTSHYVKSTWLQFLNNWSNLNPLLENARLQALGGLQRVVELDEFVQAIQALEKGHNLDAILEPLLCQWKDRFPGETSNPVAQWVNIVEDRRLMLAHLLADHSSSKRHTDLVTSHETRYYSKLSDAAREQRNFYVADQSIAMMEVLGAPQFDIKFSDMKYSLALAKSYEDKATKTQQYLNTLEPLDQVFNDMHELGIHQDSRFKQLQSQLFGSLFEILAPKNIPGQDEQEGDIREQAKVYRLIKENGWVRANIGIDTIKNPADIAHVFQKRGLKCLEDAMTKNSFAQPLQLTLAMYYDNILRRHEMEGQSHFANSELILCAEMAVKNSLLAIQNEEPGALEIFPRLLQITELYPVTQVLFKHLVSGLSDVWPFVRWIQQMVAILNKPFSGCVVPILTAIGKQYPNALYYPLTISTEKLSFEATSAGEQCKSAVNALRKLVQSPLKEDFASELQRLTNVDHLTKDWVERTWELLRSKSKTKDTEIMATYLTFHQLALDAHGSRLGPIAKSFAKEHATNLEVMCGKTGSKLVGMTEKQFSTVADYCRKLIDARSRKPQPSGADLLKSYSPWLAEFQASKFNEKLEIPGQYTGRGRLDVSSLVTIASFDQRVLVMSSIRKPKRLSILGSDEKEHLFLVKGGEDLRLDQRVQQVFSLMNDIMSGDAQCFQQKLSIQTYKVIPMNGSLGILEWVDNTKPLRACIEGQVSSNQFKQPQLIHGAFVDSYKKNVPITGYQEMFVKASREKVISHMQNLWSFFKEDLLRTYVMKLASSPEAFLAIRGEFVKSLAAINVCSYILGIGDRHLENCLVDEKTGRLIPIDFGHAFGSATEGLPVPEMMPFRMTRQLQGFMGPLGVEGLLEHPMICIMVALRNKKDVIMNTLDVFIKEPLLDWRKAAKNQAREMRRARAPDFESYVIAEDTLEPPAWYLQQKLSVAEGKLSGLNPTVLMCRELEVGHGGKPYVKHLKAIVNGDTKCNNFRATIGIQCPTVKDQILALLDLATDPNILGRTWVGWMPWV